MSVTRHCEECGRGIPAGSYRGLCKTCYMRQWRRWHGAKPAFNWKGQICSNCGASPVKAKGLCSHCYRNRLNKTSERCKTQRYLANQKKNFGGRRESILMKNGQRCARCGMDDCESMRRWGRKLDIHHKDGKGRMSQRPNHGEGNLVVLCRSCHRKLHIEMRKEAAK